MRKMIVLLLMLSLCALLAPCASGAVYLAFSGSNADGDVNGNAFSGASWLFEIQVDPSTPKTGSFAGGGRFNGAIIGSSIRINGDS